MTAPVSLLPADSTTPWEEALSLTSAERRPVDYGGLRDIWDPWKCPPAFLPYLARALGVRVWNDDWPIEKKRRATARAKEHARATGSEWLAGEYLALEDAELIQFVAPPQGFCAARDLTKEERDAWIGRMPRLRIVFAEGRGTWDAPFGFYADLCAADVDFVGINDGPAYYGRRAYLRTQGGEDIPLQVATIVETREERAAVDVERVYRPGLCRRGLVADLGAADVDFTDAEERRPEVYSYRLDRTYLHAASVLSLSTVPVGYEPLDVRYERIGEHGDGAGRFYADVDAADVGFAGADNAGFLLADVLYLHDPEVAAPMVDAMSFADVSRTGMAAHTAEILARCEGLCPPLAFVADVSVADQAAAIPDDMRKLDRALLALGASMKLSDKYGASFETTRPITLGVGRRLDTPMALDARLKNYI